MLKPTLLFVAVALASSAADADCGNGSSTFLIKNAFDLSTLATCVTVKGSVEINSPSLESLAGLEKVTAITGSLTLGDNNQLLKDLEGLKSLKRVGKDLVIKQPRREARDTPLRTLLGLRSLTTIGGALRAEGNNTGSPTLTSFDGLDSLSAVKEVRITSFQSLTQIDALKRVKAVDLVLIRGNHALASLSGLQSLEQVQKALAIWAGPALTSLAGLERVKRVGELGIGGPIATLTPLSALEEVAGNFSIDETQLEDLNGLNRIKRIGGALIITANPALRDVAALQNLKGQVGNIKIERNERLASLDGMQGVTATTGQTSGRDGNETTGGVSISWNRSLTTLDGLSGLHTVGGDLRVEGNDKLQHISGLQSLATVRGITIMKNRELSSVDGLAGLKTTTGTSIQIGVNPLLPQCQVDRLATRLGVTSNSGANLKDGACLDDASESTAQAPH